VFGGWFGDAVMGDQQARPWHGVPFEREETAEIGTRLALRVLDGTMPPDDAYVWARSLGHVGAALLIEREQMFTNPPRLSA
jgi:hypothetical protein